MKKQIQFGLLTYALTFLVTVKSIAQDANSHISIQSCYQKVVMDGPSEIFNMLESSKYKFVYPSVGSGVDYFRIQTFDQDGYELSYDYSGLVTSEFPLATHSRGGFDVVTASTVVGGNQIFNQEEFSFDTDVKSVLITPYHWTGSAPNQTLDPTNYSATLNIKTGAEAFGFEPTNSTCYTFDNFATTYSNILDGFCGEVSGEVSIVPPVPPGWSSVFSQTFNIEGNTDISTPVDYCITTCGNATAHYYEPDPVPCGCIDFNLDITILPCDAMSEVCPNYNFSIAIEICCTCDVRENPPGN